MMQVSPGTQTYSILSNPLTHSSPLPMEIFAHTLCGMWIFPQAETFLPEGKRKAPKTQETKIFLESRKLSKLTRPKNSKVYKTHNL